MTTEVVCFPSFFGNGEWRIYRMDDGSYCSESTRFSPFDNSPEVSIRRGTTPAEVAIMLHVHGMPLEAYKRVFLNEATALFFYYFGG